MAITATSTGANSVDIAYDSSETPATLMAEFVTQLTSMGWTYITTSGDFWYFYAPQIGGSPTTDLKGLRIECQTSHMYFAIYDKPDTTVNTTTDGLNALGNWTVYLDFTNGGILHLLASAQHVTLLTTENGVLNTDRTHHVAEISRDSGVAVGSDSPGFWGGFSSDSWWGYPGRLTPFKRNDGNMDTADIKSVRALTDFAHWGHLLNTSPDQMGVGAYNPIQDFVTGKVLASSIRLVYTGNLSQNARMMGRIYNTCLVSNDAMLADVNTTITINVDADGFPDNSGTPTAYRIVAVNAYMSLCVPE